MVYTVGGPPETGLLEGNPVASAIGGPPGTGLRAQGTGVLEGNPVASAIGGPPGTAAAVVFFGF